MRHERFKRSNLWKYGKTYFNLTFATVTIFVWRTISDTVFSFITYFSSCVNNQPVPIYQSSPLYLFLFEDKMFSLFLFLSLSLSLSRDTFRVKKAMKFFIFSIKISDIERSPTTIHDQPQFGLHHPQPSTVTHGKPKFCHHYPRLCTTSHNFTSTIYNHPRSAIVPLPPPTVLNFTEKLTL